MKVWIRIMVEEDDGAAADEHIQRRRLWKAYRAAEQRAEEAIMSHMANRHGPPPPDRLAKQELEIEVVEESGVA